MMHEEKQSGYLLACVKEFIKRHEIRRLESVYETDGWHLKDFLEECCHIVGYYEEEYIDE